MLRLTNNNAWDGHPSWFPDGSKIAFTSQQNGHYDIYVMNADGSEQTNLTNDPSQDDYASASPDGVSIAFAGYRESSRQGTYLMAADASNPTLILSGLTAANDWSPYGSQIAFQGTGGDGEIYSMNADGSDQTNLTNDPSTDKHPSRRP